MLSCLQIRDFAIVDELVLELGPGLNVVTGETGAGKSIVVGALELVLGGRAQAGVIRSGAKSAEVEALFEIGGDVALAEKLRAMELDVGDELVVRRVVQNGGRTRAFINGRLATREQLAALTRGLTDISSQHQHHSLTDPATHLSYLDAFGGLAEDRARVGRAYLALERASSALEGFEQRSKDRSSREALAQAAIAEIEALGPAATEEEALNRQRERLRHTEALIQLTGQAAELLYERDDSVADGLAQAVRRLEEAAALDPALTTLAERLAVASEQLQDAARELGRYVHSVRAEPDELERIEERLFQLDKLKRRYGGTLEAVLQHLAECRAELEAFEHCADASQSLELEFRKATTEATNAARRLSMMRRKGAAQLAKAITAELASLGMGEAQIVVDVLPLEPHAGRFSIDGARLSPLGVDRAEFLIAPNRGEAARPLHRIASGGELSRAMLAIKCVLADLGPAGMYAFDEVDSGVGGAMAEIIGRKVHTVSRHRQVLCVTHLPQIAVFADQHFKVEKAVTDGRTVSRVRRLRAREQREEIARMLGGLTITQKTRAAAREMLDQARDCAA